MRNIKNYVVAAFALFLLDGCDFLDYDETSGKTKEEAYSYFNNMNSSVAYVYSFLPTDFGRVSDAMMESATDNSVYTWENNSIYYITNGIWSPLKRVTMAGVSGTEFVAPIYSLKILIRKCLNVFSIMKIMMK